MSEPNDLPIPRTLPGTEGFAASDPCGEGSPAYRYVFQGWVVLFLLVICFALVNYLITFVP